MVSRWYLGMAALVGASVCGVSAVVVAIPTALVSRPAPVSAVWTTADPGVRGSTVVAQSRSGPDRLRTHAAGVPSGQASPAPRWV